ncbi:MAG: crossover junction endodeoxyribonuclease RuvC [Bdellovibrio sp.]
MSATSPQALTILGVDPGSRVTGFGVIRITQGRMEHINHGVILLEAEQSFPLRMKELGSAFREVMEKYRPHQVIIEKIFLGKNADSAFKLGHARGVVMYEAGLGGADVYEYATRVVKKSVTGTGSASKEEVQAILKALLNLQSIQRMDASDALAMACHHVFELKKKAVIERAVNL